MLEQKHNDSTTYHNNQCLARITANLGETTPIKHTQNDLEIYNVEVCNVENLGTDNELHEINIEKKCEQGVKYEAEKEKYKLDEEKNEQEEKKYSSLLSIAYALMAIVSESPYFVIISMADYFKNAFNVLDPMIYDFTIIESIVLIFFCTLLHLIGSYRLKWNLYQPLINVFILTIIYLVVAFKPDYIGHKIIIYSSIPLGFTLCIAKMTTIKICIMFKKSYCSAYVCGIALSGFSVFLLYVLGVYVLFPNNDNKFRNMFSLFCGTFSVLSIICFLILLKIYSLPFVKVLERQYGDKGFLINKSILVRSMDTIKIIWKYMLIIFIANLLTYQIYPSIFPISISAKKEIKGLLSGVLLFGDSLARLFAHNLAFYFINIPLKLYALFNFFRIGMLPVFFLIIIYKQSFLNNLYFLIFLAYIYGFTNGILSNAIFLKLPEFCKKKSNKDCIKLASNIVYISLLLGTMFGCLISKIFMRHLPIE